MKKFSVELAKSIRNSVKHETLPLPFLDSFISASWFEEKQESLLTVMEDLKASHEELSSLENERDKFFRSIITWSRFTAILASYSIPELECESVALYLRHMGVINHYRDTKDETLCFRDFVFLQPDA